MLKWLFSNHEQCVTIYQVGKLFKDAFSGSENKSTAKLRVWKSKDFPYNNDVFPDFFSLSETTLNSMKVSEKTPRSTQLHVGIAATINISKATRMMEFTQLSISIRVENTLPAVDNMLSCFHRQQLTSQSRTPSVI